MQRAMYFDPASMCVSLQQPQCKTFSNDEPFPPAFRASRAYNRVSPLQ